MPSAFEIFDTEETVYKYRVFDRNTISIFVDRQLYFASPIQLNDPHDCQVDVAAALLNALDLFDFTSAPIDRRSALIAAKEELESNKDEITKKLSETKAQYAVCSMSVANDDPIMWAHYGDEHRGICIGFNPRLVRERDGMYDLVIPTPVYYSNENPMSICIDQFMGSVFYSSTGEGPSVGSLYLMAVNMAVRAKSRAWAYEKEFRFVRLGSGSVKFEPSALVEVILGYRMSKRDRETVLNLLRSPEWSHVLVHEVVKQSYTPTFKIENLR